MTDREILAMHLDGPLSHPFIVVKDTAHRILGELSTCRSATFHSNTLDAARDYAVEHEKDNPRIWQRPTKGQRWTERVVL